MFENFTFENSYVGRFQKDEDLFKSLTDFLENNNIKTGFISGIGALQKAVLGYYNQKEFKYQTIEVDKPVEVVSFTGNVSIKDGHSFPHCHIVVADENGYTKAGHLMEGCRIFAFEFLIISLEGIPLERGFDQSTKLPLWMFSK